MDALSQRIIQSLLPTHEANNGSACMKCMQPNQRLVRCAACKCVRYCDKACQAGDWPKHKPVCKVMKAFRLFSRSAPDMPLLGGKMNVGHKFGRFQKSVLEGLVPGVPGDISDETWLRTKNLVMRSPCCSICEKSDYDFNADPSDWKSCPKCNYGWCCSADHYGEYQPEHTTELYDKYIRTTKFDRFWYNHTDNRGDRFQFAPEDARTSPMNSFPANWDEYFKMRCPMEYSMRKQLPYEFFPTATFLLSQPVTCLYGMYQHDQDFFKSAKELTIHVVGAASGFECEGGGPTCVWEEILHCLPSLKLLNVLLIGPEVGITRSLDKMESCPDCIAKGSARKHGFHALIYHDYHASEKFTKPDFVVAFNTGMFEEETESWKKSLEVLLTLDVPCVFTSYNKEEGDADFEVLSELNAHKLTDASILNPFRVKIPMVDDTSIGKLFQNNMYYICFQGRGMTRNN
ncbi:hypothetical protein ACHAWF_003808 [Thalassiosira exigua]